MWRWIALFSTFATLLWVASAYWRGDYEDDFYSWPSSRSNERDHLPNWLSLSVAVCLGVLAGYAMIVAYTPPKGVWWWCLILLIGFLAMCLVVMFRMNSDPTISSVIVVVLIVMGLLITSVIKLTDDNPFRLDHGVVIAQDFTPAHTTLVCNKVCTPIYHDDDWAIKLQDCDRSGDCKTGWLHFSSDVFTEYPVGSTYPSG